MDVINIIFEIKNHPGIYIGKASLERLYAFLGGYLYSLNKISCLFSEDQVILMVFQKYVENIYNLNTDHNWFELIQFFNISEKAAFDQFYLIFDKYLSDISENNLTIQQLCSDLNEKLGENYYKKFINSFNDVRKKLNSK